LYLVREITYVPRTRDNLARLLVESTGDDVAGLTGRIEPELARLMAAKMVAQIGEEYEFLTGERRTFEEEVATRMANLRHADREAGLATQFVFDPEGKVNHLRPLLGFETVEYLGIEFDVRVAMDGSMALRQGHVEVRMHSPLAA